MKTTNDVTALFFDHSLFLPIALKLAGSFKRVIYYSPWEEGQPLLAQNVIGDGFEEIERVPDIWKVMPEVDLCIFPDIGHSGLQLHLESMGKAVWGSRRGDTLETSREKFLKTLEDLGMEVPPHTKIKGLENLREYLKDKQDKFVKLSKFRGDLETCRWVDWDTSRSMLDVLAIRFGPVADLMPFIVCDEIETTIELGCDTFCVDGQFPDLMIHGFEAKDAGFLSSVTKREDMPEQVKEVLDLFGPVLGQYHYRNSFSAEIRVAGDKSYFIDPCCRFPMPPTGSKTELWSNLADIIWHGAQGELIQPEASAPFAAECEVSTKGEKNAWVSVEIPESIGQLFKPSNACKVNDRLCFPPHDDEKRHLGWLVATGESVEDVIEKVVKLAGEMPPNVDVNTKSLVDLLKELKEAEKEGIEFTDEKLPDPALVVETT